MSEIDLRVFPASDRTFRADVEGAIAGLQALAPEGLPVTGDDLATALRHLYPNVQVRSRDELGEVGQHRNGWYVFRDGKVRPDDWRRDRLYVALARARSAVTDSGRALERSMVSLKQGSSGWTRTNSVNRGREDGQSSSQPPQDEDQATSQSAP
jgi:hypothetical protein